MFKKIIALFLLVVLCLAPSVLAAETFDRGGVTYSVDVDYDESRSDPYGDITVTATASSGSPATSFTAVELLKYLGYDDLSKERTIISQALEDAGELEISVKVAETSSTEETPAPSTGSSTSFVDENGILITENSTETPSKTESTETSVAPAEDVISVILIEGLTSEESKVVFPDQQPVIVNDRTLVPARGVFEELGYEVSWDDATSTAIVKNEVNSIKIPVGQKYLLVGEKQVEIDVPAQLINDRTMLPLRAISQALGMIVDWDGDTNTVYITY